MSAEISCILAALIVQKKIKHTIHHLLKVLKYNWVMGTFSFWLLVPPLQTFITLLFIYIEWFYFSAFLICFPPVTIAGSSAMSHFISGVIGMCMSYEEIKKKWDQKGKAYLITFPRLAEHFQMIPVAETRSCLLSAFFSSRTSGCRPLNWGTMSQVCLSPAHYKARQWVHSYSSVGF